MINSVDYIVPGCDATFTNLKRISADIKVDLSIGLLQTLRNSPKFVCPRSISLISTYSSSNLDFGGMPWNLNTTGFAAALDVDAMRSCYLHIIREENIISNEIA